MYIYLYIYIYTYIYIYIYYAIHTNITKQYSAHIWDTLLKKKT